jgi:glycosyltransferase involved in cell wall biosynthesis
VNERNLSVLQLGKFYPPHPGGMETHLEALCRLLKDKVDLQVIVANEHRRTVSSIVDGVSVTRVGTLLHLAGTSICLSMAERVARSNADVVHLHLPNPWAAMAYLLSGHKGKLVVTYHSDVVRQRVLGTLLQPLTRRILDRASVIISASQGYIDSSNVLQRYRDKCCVIPFGISPASLQHRPEIETVDLRSRFQGPLVLTVGRLVYYKGLECLIDAMRVTQGTLLIVGEGPLRGQLTRRISRNKLEDRVFLLGEVENTTPYYHAADVFVLASNARAEAFGLAQLEAMACGKPVINTALNTGVPFVSLHGRTGLTVPPGNSEALSWALSLLLRDSELRTRYGKAARERASHHFCLTQMVNRTYRVYETAMRNGNSRRVSDLQKVS